jgi:hypothetical protein
LWFDVKLLLVGFFSNLVVKASCGAYSWPELNDEDTKE